MCVCLVPSWRSVTCAVLPARNHVGVCLYVCGCVCLVPSWRSVMCSLAS